MALVTSYSTLKSAITEETDGRALTASLDRYIQMAEGEIRAFLAINPVRPMRARTTLSISSEYVAAPADMVRPVSAEIAVDGVRSYLPYVSPESLSRMQGKVIGTNAPYAFTRVGDELRFYPVPTSIYTGSLHYFEAVPALNDGSPTNWLIAAFPNAYQSGALYYAYRDMPDIEKASLMKAVFEETLQQIAASYPEHDEEVSLSVDPHMLGWR